jgi:hypothetical protein
MPTRAAQGPSGSPAPQRVPDLSGAWVRLDPYGSGSHGGIDTHIAAPALRPEARARLDAMGRQGGGPGGPGPGAQLPTTIGKPNPEGTPYVVTTGRCLVGAAFLFLMGHSAAHHIVQARDEVLVIGEMPLTQHVYMDGRGHPDPRTWDPTPSGHSIGRYEDGVLVAETVGFAGEGRVPGGGLRTPQTTLTQRFRLTDGGARMTVSFTWEDPKIYERPHAYDYFYERQPPDAYAFEEWCDSSDPLQRQSIVPPKQTVK